MVLMRTENLSRYTVLPSEYNEKKHGDIDIASEQVNSGGNEEVNCICNVGGQETVKDDDISLHGLALLDAEESHTEVVSSQSGPLGEQDEGEEEEGISSDAEFIDEDEISESEKTRGSLQPLDERETGTNLEDVSSDAGTVNEGGSRLEALESMNSLDNWSPKEIPYHILVRATNNFSEEMMLGKGGFGPVYRGYMSDLGLDVAIKRLSERSEQGLSEYLSEVNIITQLRHRNLVKLIGWCHDHGELMLVYEFLINGSLDNHLFKENYFLEWPIRYKIALGLANALMYLHDECEPYVLHRDVKSSNVLLDSKFDAKLADFGLARFFNLDISSLRVSHPAGTRGYWAPEYALMAKASRLSDVYSYGIVALEIACGKKAILTMQGNDAESCTTLLVEWVWDLYGKGAILDAADTRLNGNFDQVQMERLLMVGLWCAHPDHRRRPHMRQASNALLYTETTHLPPLPTMMPPWAFPLDAMQMQMTQHSQLQLPTTTSMFSGSDDSTSSLAPEESHENRNLETTSEQTFRRPKRQLLAPIIRWLKRRKAADFDETVHDDRIRMIPGLREFSSSELVLATDNFSSTRKLGEGGFGVVYRGQLVSGMPVAVKRIREHGGSSREFTMEVTIMSRLVHRNVQKLVGWCHERGEHLLVREYMANGTLDRYLFRDVGSFTIPWQLRYRVALGLASALCYLHNDWERVLLHLNITSRTLFLDEEFKVRLDGFKMAKEIDHGVSLTSTSVRGTIGYIAPEYLQSGKCSTASDVYSFGVVALEIACGRRSFQYDSTSGYDSLRQWVWRCYAHGFLLEASDEKLMGNFDSREMEQLMVIGLCCTHIDPSQRPPIAKVLRVLQFEEELPVSVPDDRLIPASSGLNRVPSTISACDSDIDDCLR